MNFADEFRNLLEAVGTNVITSSAYDTAWVARLGALDRQLTERALKWLYEHELPDGGWGSSETVYGHDRFICTLAAMVALAKCGYDGLRLQRGREALEVYTQKLRTDWAGATVGFEMIVPTLIAEAEALGIISRQDNPLLHRMTRARAAKLRSLSGQKINRFITPAFSAEMVGPEIQLLDADNLQDANGSVGCSPAATTFFALHVRYQDPAALRYLHEIAVNVNGGVPYVVPIDIFEYAWALWNLKLVGVEELDDETLASIQPHLDFLQTNWTDQGIASVAGLGFKDGDATSVTCEVLTRYGRSVSIEGVRHFEEEEHFRCYAMEANASTSTNIHALGALRAAGYGKQHPAVQKILEFLWQSQTGQLFWFDKWHSSPYYPTSHAAIALAGCDDDERANKMASNVVYWIIETQRPDGSWGWYQKPTAEETAYALQALAIWKRNGGDVPSDVLRRGATWLADHTELPYPPLWIGKCLYCPELVVRSAILSALILIKQGGNL